MKDHTDSKPEVAEGSQSVLSQVNYLRCSSQSGIIGSKTEGASRPVHKYTVQEQLGFDEMHTK